MFPERQKIVMK